MKKGYLMANLRVNDPEIFAEFSSVALPLIEKSKLDLPKNGSPIIFDKLISDPLKSPLYFALSIKVKSESLRLEKTLPSLVDKSNDDWIIASV